jgi:hypothetical protein
MKSQNNSEELRNQAKINFNRMTSLALADSKQKIFNKLYFFKVDLIGGIKCLDLILKKHQKRTLKNSKV